MSNTISSKDTSQNDKDRARELIAQLIGEVSDDYVIQLLGYLLMWADKHP